MAYLYVDDADALHGEWSSVEGRRHRPEDTPTGFTKAYVDPDGNLLRYGSPHLDRPTSRILRTDVELTPCPSLPPDSGRAAFVRRPMACPHPSTFGLARLVAEAVGRAIWLAVTLALPAEECGEELASWTVGVDLDR
jgi:hypothetical protein